MDLIEKCEMISVEEMCSMLSIGRNTAYQLLKEGKIEVFRIGRRWKISRESVLKYIIENSKGSLD